MTTLDTPHLSPTAELELAAYRAGKARSRLRIVRSYVRRNPTWDLKHDLGLTLQALRDLFDPRYRRLVDEPAVWRSTECAVVGGSRWGPAVWDRIGEYQRLSWQRFDIGPRVCTRAEIEAEMGTSSPRPWRALNRPLRDRHQRDVAAAERANRHSHNPSSTGDKWHIDEEGGITGAVDVPDGRCPLHWLAGVEKQSEEDWRWLCSGCKRWFSRERARWESGDRRTAPTEADRIVMIARKARRRDLNALVREAKGIVLDHETLLDMRTDVGYEPGDQPADEPHSHATVVPYRGHSSGLEDDDPGNPDKAESYNPPRYAAFDSKRAPNPREGYGGPPSRIHTRWAKRWLGMRSWYHPSLEVPNRFDGITRVIGCPYLDHEVVARESSEEAEKARVRERLRVHREEATRLVTHIQTHRLTREEARCAIQARMLDGTAFIATAQQLERERRSLSDSSTSETVDELCRSG